jgi:uncharacterized protein YkwD
MPLSRRGLIGLSAISLLAACSGAEAFAPLKGGSITPREVTRARVVAAINGIRMAHGKPPLRYCPELETAARTQATLMATKDQLSHDLGETLRQRVSKAGYEGAVGENVAGGQQTLEQAIDGWMHSRGHRETLLSTKFVEFGLAVSVVPKTKRSRYGVYWAFIAGGPTSAWMT